MTAIEKRYAADLKNYPNGIIQEFSGKDRFLSNFWPCPVEYAGARYKNAEAAFQAQKCRDPIEKAKFENMSAKDAKAAGRRVRLRDDWNTARVDVMRGIVKDKFSRNPDLKTLLAGTRGMMLVEGNDWNDRFWGVDKATGIGGNALGLILMSVRGDLLADMAPEEIEAAVKAYSAHVKGG